MRRLGLLLGAAFLVLRVVLMGRRFERFAVSGHSMEPTLRDGDWLIVDRKGSAAPSSLVVARDPRSIGRIVVKRVRELGPDHELILESDHSAHADEVIGPVRAPDVVGVVVMRYWPWSRAGLIR
jgi:phage repressor protein C with HTH and peptisase S24 domain